MKLATRTQIFVAALLFGFSMLSQTEAGQKVYLGKKSPSQKISFEQIDHQPWHALLEKYVDADGMVNYGGLKSSAQDMSVLDKYLLQLSNADSKAKATKNATLAFWINAYNAVTVRGMLREYPTTSIRNHTAKLLGYNIWKDLQLYVSGKPYSLDDMEHEVLRKMDEPRIHFAVVCASKGCPRLLNEAYTSSKIEEQLDRNAKDFFARPANFQHKGSSLGLSSILKWYGGDFGDSRSQQLRTFSQWLPTAEAQHTAKSGKASVSFLEYDWSINEQPRKR